MLNESILTFVQANAALFADDMGARTGAFTAKEQQCRIWIFLDVCSIPTPIPTPQSGQQCLQVGWKLQCHAYIVLQVALQIFTILDCLCGLSSQVLIIFSKVFEEGPVS